jgi:hypothetical protein
VIGFAARDAKNPARRGDFHGVAPHVFEVRGDDVALVVGVGVGVVVLREG